VAYGYIGGNSGGSSTPIGTPGSGALFSCVPYFWQPERRPTQDPISVARRALFLISDSFGQMQRNSSPADMPGTPCVPTRQNCAGQQTDIVPSHLRPYQYITYTVVVDFV